MPRGGGRGGGRKQGNEPEAYDDEEPTPIAGTTIKPAPTFPPLYQPIPKPLSTIEVASVNAYLNFRTRSRRGPFFATLDPSSLTDENGKVRPRAGFDPFNDQERYTSRFQKKKRTVPDVAGQEFALQMFPKELWLSLDPKRTHPLWKTVDPAEFEMVKSRKRRRRLSDTGGPRDGTPAVENSGDESDGVVTGRRKLNAAKSRKGEPASKQRRGLDAEDDFPEDSREADDDADVDMEAQDSEFSESEDDDNDYNAEQYFDDGDDDGMEDDGGGGDDYY
ncbi:uncharacterized protein AB675_11495 [Cyphellophora attinorum]|uniref:DNA-directed RNA polymerase III subunit n=1 Tax=Cyphellophora attinorum TaxID=1664694 RepID=A0A0N1HB26_9EURO|nr:uncharacterized protein AB675_11495 [Phialophora attinorum]KPI40190.1 hypothetical protein AB675_11495 [Phialophora attinorum]